MNRFQRPPWWFIALIAVALVPVFQLPAMMGSDNAALDTLKMLLWGYPVALVASAYYAFVSYSSRQLLAWIMLIFMVMIDASMIYLFILGPEVME